MFEPGHIVLNKYAIERLIGAGGMGLIYRARDTSTQRAVAVKCLRPTSDLSENDIRRFEREARLLVQLQHENVLDVIEVGVLETGAPALVMELLEGRDLRQEIKVREHFPVEEAVGYLLQASAAVGAVHRAGIIHRDIKPQNLFITNLTGARHLKLLDFGISKTDEDGEMTLTATQGTLGTPQYMSPEQILGAKKVDQRTDIWALGVMLYFLLAGKLPFTGPSPSAVIAAIPGTEPQALTELRNDIPPELIALVSHCLAKDRDKRVASAELLHELLLPFGPPDGTIIAPAVAVPSTVPPISLGLRRSFLPIQALPNMPVEVDLGVTRDLMGTTTPRLMENPSRGEERALLWSTLELTRPGEVQIRTSTSAIPVSGEETVPSSRRVAARARRRRIAWGKLSLGLGMLFVAAFVFRQFESQQERGAALSVDGQAIDARQPVEVRQPVDVRQPADAGQALGGIALVEASLPQKETGSESHASPAAAVDSNRQPQASKPSVSPAHANVAPVRSIEEQNQASQAAAESGAAPGKQIVSPQVPASSSQRSTPPQTTQQAVAPPLFL